MPKKKVTKRLVKKASKKVAKKAAPKKTTKKAVVVAPPPVAPPVAVAPPVYVPPPPVVRSAADAIWDEIKNLPIQMFALPGQTVELHCTPVPVEPSRLYVSVRSPATLPALELALDGRFVVEQVDKWVTVSRKPAPLTAKK